MRLLMTVAALTFALSAGAALVHGQGRGNGQAKKQATQAKTRVDSPKGNASTAKQGAKAEARTAKAAARTTKAEARAARAETKSARKTPVAPTPTAEVAPTTPTTRPVKNPKLEARLQTMLPAGVTVQDAMTGFKNWGQFVAAVHVSNNLNIPFADLKARMTGITPGTTVQGTPMSLGQAIQSLKGTSPAPDGTTLTSTKIRREVKKAEDAANAELRRSRART